MGSWKKMIFGEKMPDKNDPQYKERYEKEVELGRKTARYLKIDKAAVWLQKFANRHPLRFLTAILLIMICCSVISIYRLYSICEMTKQKPQTTVMERQETLLKQKRLSNERNL